jgi:hypothetical protein
MCVEHVRRSDRVQLCESHHSKFNGYENMGTLKSDSNRFPLNLDSLQNKGSDRIEKSYKIRGLNSSHSHSHSHSHSISGGNSNSNVNDECESGSEVPSRSELNLVRSLSRARRGRRGSDGSNSSNSNNNSNINSNSNSNNGINSGSGARRGERGDGRGGAEEGGSSNSKVNPTLSSYIPSPNTKSTPPPDGHGVLTFREYVTVSMIGR